jgi:predicted nucleic acid-binding protein
MVRSKIILDTNVYSKLIEGNGILKTIVENSTDVYIPVIVLGELLFGFKNGTRINKNLNLFNEFIEQNRVKIMDTSNETAIIFADIKLSLMKKGRPIPTNDIWIAALAIESGSVLLTFDRQFESIPGLRLHSWN